VSRLRSSCFKFRRRACDKSLRSLPWKWDRTLERWSEGRDLSSFLRDVRWVRSWVWDFPRVISPACFLWGGAFEEEGASFAMVIVCLLILLRINSA